MNPPVQPVTARAKGARAAPVRPLGYAQRWAKRNTRSSEAQISCFPWMTSPSRSLTVSQLTHGRWLMGYHLSTCCGSSTTSASDPIHVRTEPWNRSGTSMTTLSPFFAATERSLHEPKTIEPRRKLRLRPIYVTGSHSRPQARLLEWGYRTAQLGRILSEYGRHAGQARSAAPSAAHLCLCPLVENLRPVALSRPIGA